MNLRERRERDERLRGLIQTGHYRRTGEPYSAQSLARALIPHAEEGRLYRRQMDHDVEFDEFTQTYFAVPKKSEDIEEPETEEERVYAHRTLLLCWVVVMSGVTLAGALVAAAIREWLGR